MTTNQHLNVITLFSGYDSRCLALNRLMDVEEKDIDTLLASPIPRTQHAKLAGNSIVVACLYYIFRNLFVNTEPAAGTQTELF
ncbi:MAG: hypothetical protein IKV77_05155 [Alistipes sp.]|nr:hypothetical protein [Bacteroidales bacterium]MBR5492499.1 hypothetical protein [Alistipes sp.]MBR5920050.1 hypothetical protein [Bacteroidales bacterium]